MDKKSKRTPMDNINKIVIIGPESTGKSELAASLAAHYATVWCPEYARAYLEEHGADYTYEDLLLIAQGQLIIEDDILNDAKNGLYFIDTNMYVMKVWSEFVFGKCHPFILNEIATRKYDFYLLCDTDLEWEEDELREYPDIATRRKLFDIYSHILKQQTVPWAVVSGTDDDRTTCALNAVENFLKKGTHR